MFPLNPKPPLSAKELIEKVIRLKPEFDKLTDYNAKLEFWNKNDFNIGVTTYGISDEKDKRDLPENNISIYPKNNDEVKAYKKFYHTLFRNYSFNNLDALTDKYWRKIEQGADPIPYTKREIAEIDAQYESNKKNFKTSHNTLRSYANGFEASQNGVIEDFLNSNYFRENLLSYFTGEVDEKHRRFLVKQLKQLESGKPSMFDAQEKLHISCRLLGENKLNTSQLDFYHIPYILHYFNINPKEGREILLFSKGAFTPKMNVEIVEKIVAHLERVYPEILMGEKQSLSETKTATKKTEVLYPLNLIDFFDSISKYQHIMNLLIQNGYCQPNTHIWKDETNGSKGFLAAILKHLHKQQYYKENKRPTNEQIQAISKSTFGWDISIDTIKKSKPESFDLSFIPPASTIA